MRKNQYCTVIIIIKTRTSEDLLNDSLNTLAMDNVFNSLMFIYLFKNNTNRDWINSNKHVIIIKCNEMPKYLHANNTWVKTTQFKTQSWNKFD